MAGCESKPRSLCWVMAPCWCWRDESTRQVPLRDSGPWRPWDARCPVDPQTSGWGDRTCWGRGGGI